jgi:hypothetical protein
VSPDEIFILGVIVASLGLVAFGAMRSRQRESRQVESAVVPEPDDERARSATTGQVQSG